MKHAILIASGAYVEPELEAEFGHIPPAFLPLGNRRLFVHQRAALEGLDARFLLSLPDDFVPDQMDLDLLMSLGIEVVPVPVGLPLGQSIVHVINVTAVAGEQFSILHGDTLIRGIDFQASDSISISSVVPTGYRWGYVEVADGVLQLCDPDRLPDTAVVLDGYFAFADASKLVQTITRNGGAFLQGLSEYSRTRPMRTIPSPQWYDFGHVNTYHQSRQAITTQRAFNTLTVGRRDISKSSSNPHKIVAEARWFEALPPPMRVYTPAYLGLRGTDTELCYGVEYLHLPTLADLFVFGRLPGRAWQRIMASCGEFMDACASHTSPAPSPELSQTMYGEKTFRRLDRFAAESGVSLTQPCRFNGHWLPSLDQMARMMAELIPMPVSDKATLIHGDFCFSNILYDFRADGIRVIDPRGLDANDAFSAFGDARYDIGKLYHSAIGKYDLIMAGYYDLTEGGALDLQLNLPDNVSTQALAETFLRHSFAGQRAADPSIHAISVLLFLSMLLLHSDDRRRQLALLANAMRLFHAIDRA